MSGAISRLNAALERRYAIEREFDERDDDRKVRPIHGDREETWSVKHSRIECHHGVRQIT